MGAQKFRIYFLLGIAICALCYTTYTLWETWNYLRLDHITKLENVTWEIVSTDEETHQLKAHYTFPFKGTNFTGTYLFKKPLFINRLGAEHAIDDFDRQYHQGWFSSGDPRTSSLEKKFPTKELFSTTILWGIFIYFVALGTYCDRRS